MDFNNKDIISLEDIKLLVDTFYNRVRENQMLGPIFDDVIKDRWANHLDTMYRFWQTVLLDERTYSGSPGMKHLALPVTGEHFEIWLKLFYKTVDELFSGEKAGEAKMRAAKMAEMFAYKVGMYQKNQHTIL